MRLKPFNPLGLVTIAMVFLWVFALQSCGWIG